MRWINPGKLFFLAATSFTVQAQEAAAVVAKDSAQVSAKVPAALPGVGQIVISFALVV